MLVRRLLHHCKRGLRFPLLQQRGAKAPVSPHRAWRELEYLAVHRFGFCISTRHVIDVSEDTDGKGVERITGERRANLPFGGVPTAKVVRGIRGP
jgi:hypothetical protein